MQEEAQRIDGVNAHVSNGPAACHAAVIDPRAGTVAADKAEVRGGKDRSADGAFGNPRTHPLDREVIAKVLGHAEGTVGRACGVGHADRFGGAHRQRLLAEHGFAATQGEQCVLAVQGIRAGHEHCIDSG